MRAKPWPGVRRRLIFNKELRKLGTGVNLPRYGKYEICFYHIEPERHGHPISKERLEAPAKIKASGSKELLLEFVDWLQHSASGPFGHHLHYNSICPADLHFALSTDGKERFHPVLVEGKIKDITGPREGQVF